MASMVGIEKAIPFIVFIIWIFSAVLRQNKSRQSPVSPKQSAPPSKSRPGASLFGELRRSLQTALEEFDTPQSSPQEASLSSQAALDDFRRSDETLEVNADEESYFRGSHRNISKSSNSSIDTSPAVTVPANTMKFTSENIREGIIWAEILSPPLSLREHE